MNKRSLLLLLMLLLIISTAFVACTMEEYTVTFVVDGETYHTTTVSKEPIVMPEDPTKTGYMFSGWYNGDVKFDGSASVTKNITLTAKWRANSYNVSLDTNGGECDTQTLQVVYGENATLPVATKNGYSFAGWQYNNQLIDGNNWSIANDCTLVAQWTTLAYQITYNLDGGTNSNSNPMSYTVVDNFSLQQPTKEGYTFMGWTTDSNSTPAKDIQIAVGTTGNKTYTANWQANTYTITYDANGGTVAQQTQQVTFDEQVSLLIPTRNGYTFDGWYLNDTKYEGGKYAIANNITLKAKWSIITYDIAYNLNGGVNNDTNPATYNVENAITLGQPTKTGYSFVGWITENVATPTKDIQIAVGTTGNKTYTAKWQANTYTITYDANGGTVSQQTQQVIFDEQVTFAEPTRNGYTFAGWQYNSQIVDIEKWNIADNCTFVAQWEAIVYGITYELGVTSSNSNPASYTIENNVVLQDLSQEGYTFLGWTTDGTTEPTKTLQISVGSTGNKTFVAHWQIITYTVTYQANGGVETEQPINSFTVEQLPLKLQLNSTSKDGHYFDGWYFDEQLTLPATEITTIGDKTIYAKFIAESQSLEFTLADDGQSYIVTGYNGNETEVVIPEIYNGFPVTAIGDEAFSGCTNITFLHIPQSILSIGYRTFYNCVSLKKLILSNNLKSIGQEAFYGCSGLTSIDVPDSVTSIGEGAFSYCHRLTDMTLPFIGGSIKSSNNSYQYPFGYIFGTASYAGGVATTQHFYGLSTSSTTYETYCIPKSLKSVTITGGQILRGAFYNCSYLTSIIIPEGVMSIGERAFYGCSSLTSITIPDSVTSIGEGAFSSCSSLTSIAIPEGVTSIDSYAFRNCSSLTSIAIPDSVTSTGLYVFSGCSSLTSVHITDIAAWCNIRFSDSTSNPLYYAHNLYLNGEPVTELVIPDSVTSIGHGTFYGCRSFTSVIFGENSQLTSISYEAFHSCSSLTSITIPDSVTSIGHDTFYGCRSLTSVTFGDNSQLTSIGESAFYNCSSLTSIAIPEGVTSIGSSAFTSCSRLTSITIPEGVTSIGSSAFTICSSLTSVTFGENSQLTSIGEYTFRYCSRLTSITIPDSVTSIGEYAFGSCSRLTSVTFGENSQLTSISKYAFSGCSSLTSITIPDGVTSIGKSAFSSCSRLTSVTFEENSQLTSISEYTFSGCSSLTSVTFGENSHLTSIGESAFSSCSSLKNIVIPESVTTIGLGVFNGCSSLESITLPFIGGSSAATSTSASTLFGYIFGTSDYTGSSATEQYYEYYSDSYTHIYYIPISLKFVTITGGKILYGAFYNCSNLTSVTIADNVTLIGSYAFYNCGSLTSVTFGENSQLTSIGECAFSGCSSLIDIIIPDSATSIDEYAFDGCNGWQSYNDFDNYASYLCNTYNNYSILVEVYSENITSCQIMASTRIICDSAFSDCSKLTSITIPDSVRSIGESAFEDCSSLTSVTFGDNSQLTLIGTSVFRGCSSLTSITIPDSVTSIGFYAFSGCSSLTRINSDIDGVFIIPNSVTSIGTSVFHGCISLTSVTIPESVTSIGLAAFSGCISLTRINSDIDGVFIIPNSVTSIGSYAFSDCSSLTSITIPEGVTSIGSYAFSDCSSLTSITIPEGVTSIGEYAFSYCSSLTSITIPDSVTSIGSSAGSYAFSYCSSLTSVIFGENSQLKTIGVYAFRDCSSLTSITIPDSVTSIGLYAFYNCSSLTSVTIPDSVTSIALAAFSGCSSLTSITLPFVGGNVKSSSDTYQYPFGYIFGESRYNGSTATEQYYYGSITNYATYDTYYIPTSLKSVIITGGNILAGAFYNCSGLTSITIPDSVTSIGASAFRGCSSLTSVTIPDSVTSIGDYAFRDCTSLTSITIPDSVTSIDSYAFYNFYGVVYCKGTNADIESAYDKIYYYSESEPEKNIYGSAYIGHYWRYVDGVPTVWKIEE